MHHDAGRDRDGERVVDPVDRDAHDVVGRLRDLSGDSEALASQQEDHIARKRLQGGHRTPSVVLLHHPERAALRRATASGTRTMFSYLCIPIDAFAYQLPSPTRKTSRARKLCATRMTAPMANALPAASRAIEKSLRSGPSASRMLWGVSVMGELAIGELSRRRDLCLRS